MKLFRSLTNGPPAETQLATVIRLPTANCQLSAIQLKWSRTLWGFPGMELPPTPMSSAWFLSVEKLESKNTFNQRSQKM